jgi:hypothetical protein
MQGKVGTVVNMLIWRQHLTLASHWCEAHGMNNFSAEFYLLLIQEILEITSVPSFLTLSYHILYRPTITSNQ